MSEPLVLVEAEGPILVVTINRPEKKNAANAEVLCRLYDAWVRLDTDDSLRVAILTGKGDTFCAGMDLAEIGRLRQGVVDNEWLQRFKDQPEVILGGWLKTYRPTKPVILAAEGFARAGDDLFILLDANSLLDPAGLAGVHRAGVPGVTPSDKAS